MSRFTYFLKMNNNKFKTLSLAGGNVDLNIENMPKVAKGVANSLGITIENYMLGVLDKVTQEYKDLSITLGKLASMKTGYIKDLADGAQKFLSKKIVTFYADLYKVLENKDNTLVGNMLKLYAFIDTIKVVIDGANDLADAILRVSYNPDDEDVESVQLNTKVYTKPLIAQQDGENRSVEPINNGLKELEGGDDIADTTNSSVSPMALDKVSK